MSFNSQFVSKNPRREAVTSRSSISKISDRKLGRSAADFIHDREAMTQPRIRSIASYITSPRSARQGPKSDNLQLRYPQHKHIQNLDLQARPMQSCANPVIKSTETSKILTTLSSSHSTGVSTPCRGKVIKMTDMCRSAPHGLHCKNKDNTILSNSGHVAKTSPLGSTRLLVAAPRTNALSLSPRNVGLQPVLSPRLRETYYSINSDSLRRNQLKTDKPVKLEVSSVKTKQTPQIVSRKNDPSPLMKEMSKNIKISRCTENCHPISEKSITSPRAPEESLQTGRNIGAEKFLRPLSPSLGSEKIHSRFMKKQQEFKPLVYCTTPKNKTQIKQNDLYISEFNTPSAIKSHENSNASREAHFNNTCSDQRQTNAYAEGKNASHGKTKESSPKVAISTQSTPKKSSASPYIMKFKDSRSGRSAESMKSPGRATHAPKMEMFSNENIKHMADESYWPDVYPKVDPPFSLIPGAPYNLAESRSPNVSDTDCPIPNYKGVDDSSESIMLKEVIRCQSTERSFKNKTQKSLTKELPDQCKSINGRESSLVWENSDYCLETVTTIATDAIDSFETLLLSNKQDQWMEKIWHHDPSQLDMSHLPKYQERIATSQMIILHYKTVPDPPLEMSLTEATQECLESLKDTPSWQRQFCGLIKFQSLSKKYPAEAFEMLMPAVVSCVVKCCQSTRSGLNKMAIYTIYIMFMHYKNQMEPWIQDLIPCFWKKLGMSNPNFIQAAVHAVLDEIPQELLTLKFYDQLLILPKPNTIALTEAFKLILLILEHPNGRGEEYYDTLSDESEKQYRAYSLISGALAGLKDRRVETKKICGQIIKTTYSLWMKQNPQDPTLDAYTEQVKKLILLCEGTATVPKAKKNTSTLLDSRMKTLATYLHFGSI